LHPLAAGDQLLTSRIDRLTRSMFELFAIVKNLSNVQPYEIYGEFGTSES